MSEEWDIQDTNGVQAIYIQPRSEGVQACISFEMVGGPKRYMRVWPREDEGTGRLEWGWSLSETAEKVWSLPLDYTR